MYAQGPAPLIPYVVCFLVHFSQLRAYMSCWPVAPARRDSAAAAVAAVAAGDVGLEDDRDPREPRETWRPPAAAVAAVAAATANIMPTSSSAAVTAGMAGRSQLSRQRLRQRQSQQQREEQERLLMQHLILQEELHALQERDQRFAGMAPNAQQAPGTNAAGRLAMADEVPEPPPDESTWVSLPEPACWLPMRELVRAARQIAVLLRLRCGNIDIQFQDNPCNLFDYYMRTYYGNVIRYSLRGSFSPAAMLRFVMTGDSTAPVPPPSAYDPGSGGGIVPDAVRTSFRRLSDSISNVALPAIRRRAQSLSLPRRSTSSVPLPLFGSDAAEAGVGGGGRGIGGGHDNQAGIQSARLGQQGGAGGLVAPAPPPPPPPPGPQSQTPTPPAVLPRTNSETFPRGRFARFRRRGSL